MRGHLGVDDAAAGGHELEVAGVDGAFVAGEVFVVDGAAEEVGYCFLAAVRVVREASAWCNRKVVEHKEWAEVAEFGRSDRSSDCSSSAFGLFDGLEDLCDATGLRRGGCEGRVVGRDDREADEC